MNNFKKIHIFKGLHPHLRLITAYTPENVHVFFTLCATIILIVIPIPVVLATWHLVEMGNLMKIVVAVPILTNLLAMELAFITLIWKNRIVMGMIARLQGVIEMSE